MKMREFNHAEAELIAETTSSTMSAASHIIRQVFSHYVVNHAEDEDEVTAVTAFYEHLQDEILGMKSPTPELIMAESKALMEEFDKTSDKKEEKEGK